MKISPPEDTKFAPRFYPVLPESSLQTPVPDYVVRKRADSKLSSSSSSVASVYRSKYSQLGRGSSRNSCPKAMKYWRPYPATVWHHNSHTGVLEAGSEDPSYSAPIFPRQYRSFANSASVNALSYQYERSTSYPTADKWEISVSEDRIHYPPVQHPESGYCTIISSRSSEELLKISKPGIRDAETDLKDGQAAPREERRTGFWSVIF
jgi:hypothetical protein